MSTSVKSGIAFAAILCIGLVELSSSSKCESQLKNPKRDGYTLDSISNLAVLEEYAKELKSKRIRLFRKDQKRVDELIKAKIESESLEPRCDMAQYQLMDSVITSIYGKPLGYTQPRDCFFRFDTLFGEILSKYLEKCRPIHEKKLEAALAEVGADDRAAAELLTSTYFTGVRPVEPIPGPTFGVINANTLLQRTSLLPLRGLNSVFNVVKKASPEAASTMKQMGAKAASYVAEMLEKFLFSKCDRFLQKLGGVTEISRLDHLTTTDHFREEKFEFYETIIEGHMCRLALGERKELPKRMAERMWEIDETK